MEVIEGRHNPFRRVGQCSKTAPPSTHILELPGPHPLPSCFTEGQQPSPEFPQFTTQPPLSLTPTKGQIHLLRPCLPSWPSATEGLLSCRIFQILSPSQLTCLPPGSKAHLPRFDMKRVPAVCTPEHSTPQGRDAVLENIPCRSCQPWANIFLRAGEVPPSSE